MCDGFNHGALQIAVAQICQSMGWDALQKSTHDLLTDVLQKYLEEIAKSAHGYCQLYCRTEPNLDDLNHAFQDVGVCLHELEDFVSQVDQVPFIHQLPRFPKPKPCALHHPCNGEVAERLEQYYDYLPPLVSKLLQNEDENKAATDAEEAESTIAGDEQRTVEGFVRNEIKTVGEETSNSQVAVKRPLDTPIVSENEAKKRRIDLPFLQKGNRGNEMDILDALQGNLSSPSPTPSPDIWSTAKTFEIPPTLPPVTSANSAEDAGPSKPIAKLAKKKEENPPVKPLVVESKSSPKKKAKTPKNTASPVSKSASLLTSPPTPSKEKPPSAVKSPLEKKKKPSTPETPAKMKGKTTPKKDKKVAVKAVKPDVKSPPPKKAPDCSKENVMAKEAMPKLIIKPIKKENDKEPQLSFSDFSPPGDVSKQEKSEQKKSQAKDSIGKKKKSKKPKEETIPVFQAEASEPNVLSSASEGLKPFLSEFALTTPVAPPKEISAEHGLEHKKKKKKRKEKDKDKEKRKDRSSKKMKIDHPEPLQSSLFTAPPIPRITVKLEPPAQSAASTSKATIKKETVAGSLGAADNTVEGSAKLSSPNQSDKQEPASVTSPVAKLTIKSETLVRTVVSQTVSTTVVHGYSKEYFCPVCGDPDDGSFMIGCDGCDEWYHGRCVGILDDPGNDWFCSSCLAKKDKDSKDKTKKKKKKKSKEKGK